MSEIAVSNYPHLQGGKATWADYSIATTFGDIDIIVFNKIPKAHYSFVELSVEKIIEHEILHIVTAKLEGTSRGFDVLFPFVDSWSDCCRRLSRKKRLERGSP